MAVRFLQENPVPRKEKGAPISRCAFAFPLRCGHFLHCSAVTNSEQQFSISNSHQMLPLPDVAFEADASGNLKRRDHASFDWLAALSGAIAS